MVDQIHLGDFQKPILGFNERLTFGKAPLTPKDFFTVSVQPFLQEKPQRRKCREKTNDGDIGIPGGRELFYGMTLVAGLPFIITGGILLANNHETSGAIALGGGIALSTGLTLYFIIQENKNCDN